MNILTNIITNCIIILLISFLLLKFAINPIVPASVLLIYIIIVLSGLVLYVTSTPENQAEFWQPIATLLTDPKLAILKWLLMLVIPAIVAVVTGINLLPSNQAPISLRVVHPAPPAEIDYNGETIDMATAVNPYRELEHSDKASFDKHVENGRRVYYENCHFCHGDFLDGKGPYAEYVDPRPANFQDVGTIAQLQESYVFWRIAKGAPGLPKESQPWQSVMPAWESILSQEEAWDVILFLYKATNHPPRTFE